MINLTFIKRARITDALTLVKVCLIAISLLSGSISYALQAPLPKVLTLYDGQSKAYGVSGAIRVTVGDTSLISATMLKTGDIVLVAEGQGETNLLVWYEDGSATETSVIIVEEDGYRQSREVASLLEQINGIDVSLVGRRIVVDGQIDSRDLARVKAVQQRYGDILILAREISTFEQKMLHFDVKITEISRDVTEELGINWSTSFAGPTLNYERAWNQGANLAIPETNENASYLFGNNFSDQGSIDLTLGEAISGAGAGLTVDQQRRLVDAQERSYTYWGIGTSIISMINLLESNGAANTLTQPRISARSGGMAELVVGGEIPVVTSSINGPTVTYKNYGIQLEISPEVDQYDNIMGQVAVEVSALDLSNAVDGQPAFRKRSSKNDIRLAPGETLALAGLIQQEEQIAYSGIKWLQDIPLLGNLFRNKSFTSGKTELVILITPTEIEDLSAGANQKLIDRAQDIRSDFEELKYELSQYPKTRKTEEPEPSGSEQAGP